MNGIIKELMSDSQQVKELGGPDSPKGLQRLRAWGQRVSEDI